MLKILLLGLLFATASVFASELMNMDYDQSEKDGYKILGLYLPQDLSNGDRLEIGLNIGIHLNDYKKAAKRDQIDLDGMAAEFEALYENSGLNYAEIVPPEFLNARCEAEAAAKAAAAARVAKAKAEGRPEPELEEPWLMELDQPLIYQIGKDLLEHQFHALVRRYATEKQFISYSYLVVPIYKVNPEKPCTK